MSARTCFDVGGLDLIEGDDAEACVVGVGRVREGDGQRADGAGDETLAAGCVADAIGPFAALLRGLLVDLPGEDRCRNGSSMIFW